MVAQKWSEPDSRAVKAALNALVLKAHRCQARDMLRTCD